MPDDSGIKTRDDNQKFVLRAESAFSNSSRAFSASGVPSYGIVTFISFKGKIKSSNKTKIGAMRLAGLSQFIQPASRIAFAGDLPAPLALTTSNLSEINIGNSVFAPETDRCFYLVFKVLTRPL